jgi:hypothetical protein
VTTSLVVVGERVASSTRGEEEGKEEGEAAEIEIEVDARFLGLAAVSFFAAGWWVVLFTILEGVLNDKTAWWPPDEDLDIARRGGILMGYL